MLREPPRFTPEFTTLHGRSGVTEITKNIFYAILFLITAILGLIVVVATSIAGLAVFLLKKTFDLIRFLLVGAFELVSCVAVLYFLLHTMRNQGIDE